MRSALLSSALSALLLTGCYDFADWVDESSQWAQPGAYPQLVAGEKRGGYEVWRIEPSPGLPFDDPIHVEGVNRTLSEIHGRPADGAEPSIFVLHRDVDGYRFWVSAGGEPSQDLLAGLRDDAQRFLRNVSGASDDQVGRWADAFARNGLAVLPFDEPLRTRELFEAVRSLPDARNDSAGSDDFFDDREAQVMGDWKFVFEIERKTATRWKAGTSHTFDFSPTGTVRYVRMATRDLDDADLESVLRAEFDRLGLGPARADGVRFLHHDPDYRVSGATHAPASEFGIHSPMPR